MIDMLLRSFVKSVLWFRYRVRTVGIERIAAGGTKGILFLPNHPALIDPIVMGAVLNRTFGARFLADREQIDRFFIRWAARRINVIPMADPGKIGAAARGDVRQALRAVVEALRAGDNVVLYPAGHLVGGRLESLAGTSAVELILSRVPDVRVVAARTRGLWGSLFSRAYGRVPSVGRVARKAAVALPGSGLFFMPRRKVTIEFHEPADLPRSAGRAELNAYLEAWYNADAPPARYVPFTPWERGGERQMPEPDWGGAPGDLSAVPASTRQTVVDYLHDRTGAERIEDEAHLAVDLGMDSLARADLLTWVTGEFGYPPGDVEAMQTVGDVMLAACGELASALRKELKPVPPKWSAGAPSDETARLPAGRTIPEAFLAQAARRPGQVIVADQTSGVRTYRDLITAVMVLRPRVAALPGERVGIMLPAGVAADVVYLATLFARKTPVMVNWTVGPRNLTHCMELVGVNRVLTAEALTARLASMGTDLSGVRERFVFLERMAKGISPAAKLWAWVRSRVSWASLRAEAARLDASDHAAVLFTSGSEAMPKAVPLTHANILANVGDIAALDVVLESDRILGILPPFHSFGLTVTSVLPLCVGVPVVHHPDPTESPMLSRLIEAYGATLMVGTPTFLGGIARAAAPEQLAPLRLAVTGAEKCTDRVYDALEQVNPKMTVLEGYGVTECSPIISVNRPGREVRGSIGLPVGSVDHAIVDVDTGRRVSPGQAGMLLVAGPNVFGGYLQYDGPSPFVEMEGRQWYRTGDLVSESPDGVLTFRGRLKRFVKLGGEMVSLPAVEAVLEQHHPPGAGDEGPVLAVEATGDEDHPEIVLFTTRPLDRETANRQIREAGLSGLHNIRRVVRVDEIPVLGTGKTDYRALKRRLAEDE